MTRLIQVPDHLQGRIQIFSLDFFEEWPSFKVDCAILSRVLHDWSDENCVRILKKVYQVLSDTPNHRLYIIENTSLAPLLDLNMLIMTEGKERTINDFETILKEAQFILENTCLMNGVSTIFTARRSV